MKKLVLFLTALILLTGAGACKKVNKQLDKLLTFYVADEYAFSLPAVPALLSGQTVPVAFQTSTDATDEFRAANTAADLVKDVKLDELTLTVTGPSGANFDFLERVTFYMSTDAQGADRVKMASLLTVPRGVSTIRLDPYEANLDKYLKAPQYYLTVEPTFRGATSQATDMRINYKFKVTADPL
jgi:hypothetical protein